MRVETTSPESIYEKDILVPWDTDLPIEIRLWEPNEDATFNRIDFNLAGHKVYFRIYEYEPTTIDIDPIIEFSNSSWDRDQSDDQGGVAVDNILKRLVIWEELSDLQPGVDYFYMLIGETPLPERYAIMKGVFRKGTD